MRKEDIQKILRQYRGNKIDIDEATDLLFNMMKGTIAMTVQRRRPEDLSRISVRSIQGLTPEDISELQQLDLGSLQKLIDAINHFDGDLTQLSNNSIVIEVSQNDRIVRSVLSDSRTPLDFKNIWEVTGNDAIAVAPKPSPKQDDQPSQSFWESFKRSFNKVSSR